MKNIPTKLEILQENYFDKLEENCVRFSEFDDAGNSIVIDEYNGKSIQEMCEYLDMPDWVIEWTVELIEEEEKKLKEIEQDRKEWLCEKLVSNCCGAVMDCDSSFCPECHEHAVGEPEEIDTCTEYGIIKNETKKEGSTIL